MSKRTDSKQEEEPAKPEAFHWPFPRFDFGKESKGVYSGPNARDAYRKSLERGAEHRTATDENRGTEVRSNDSGRTLGPGIADAVPKRRGRPPRNATVLDQHGDLPVVQPSEANTVRAGTNVESKTLASQSGEQPVKRGRGRPRKIKPLD